MTSIKNQVYVEFDLPYCSLDFGVSPCTATGTPCFNTRNFSHDCGDPANYDASTITVRFAMDTGEEFWPLDDVPTFPILSGAASRSAEIKPAQDMGVRASCTITLRNSLSLMSGLDKNIIARSEDFSRGTFLGKFRARNPYIFGSPVRVYRGGGDGQFEVEHYTIDNFSGPDNMGGMTFNCVDFLKLTNGDSSQFPAVTVGELSADLSDFELDNTFTVTPAGIGDLQYPASGKVAIGKEGMSFTRVGDNFTVVRGELGEISSHSEDDNVQLIGEYTSQTAADIIYDLIVNYTPLDASYIDLQSWQDEINEYQNILLSATIVKPISVAKLINEIIEQAGLIFYADVRTKKIILKVLRPIISTLDYDEDKIINFSQRDMQRDRVSQVWTYYNQKNPFLQLTDPYNYYSVLVSPTAENLYQTESIKKIYSRWLPSFAASAADDLNTRILERYTNPPRIMSFNLFKDEPVRLGQGISVSHRANEDAFGDPQSSLCHVTMLGYGAAQNKVQVHEFNFTNYTGLGGGPDKVIAIDADSLDINLRALYDQQYATLSGTSSVTFIVRSGVFIGGSNNQVYGLTIGDFEGILTPQLVIESGAYIVGAAGAGGIVSEYNENGNPIPTPVASPQTNGGNALFADFPVDIDNQGTIAAAGGASGAGEYAYRDQRGFTQTTGKAPGLPGAGFQVGSGGVGAVELVNGIPQITPPAFGFKDAGFTPSDFADYINNRGRNEQFISSTYTAGGDFGQDGGAGSYAPGGVAGDAIHGISNITWTNMGTIIGATS